MPSLTFRQSTQGLWLRGDADHIPLDALRRNTGVQGRLQTHITSRDGSTSVATKNAHSLVEFGSEWYIGESGNVFSVTEATNVITGLNGNRLTFAKMAPASGVKDFLFIAGGGSLKKIEQGAPDASTRWGLAPPSTGVAAAQGSSGALNIGTYKYKFTFYVSATGSESDANTTATSVTIADLKRVDLTSIDVSSDGQVTARRVYRTLAGQEDYFLLTTITDNTTTTYTDNTNDTDLSSTLLKTDNLDPSDGAFTFNECLGPYNGRMWWTRDTAAGHKARVYYSPIGRAEAVQGFLILANENEDIQRLVKWNNSLWAIGVDLIHEVVGFTEPFTFRTVKAAPGTTYLWSVVATPYGIVYRSEDTIRLFNGTSSVPIGMEALGRLLKDGTVENVASMDDTQIGGYHEDEYFMSDASSAGTTLALYLGNQTWRDIGVTSTIFHSSATLKKFGYCNGTTVMTLEDPGTTQDAAANIPFNVQQISAHLDIASEAVLQRLYIDADTTNQAIIPTLVFFDGSTTALTAFTHNGRTVTEYPLSVAKRIIGLRFHAASGINGRIEIFETRLDLYLSETYRSALGQAA